MVVSNLRRTIASRKELLKRISPSSFRKFFILLKCTMSNYALSFFCLFGPVAFDYMWIFLSLSLLGFFPAAKVDPLIIIICRSYTPFRQIFFLVWFIVKIQKSIIYTCTVSRFFFHDHIPVSFAHTLHFCTL